MNETNDVNDTNDTNDIIDLSAFGLTDELPQLDPDEILQQQKEEKAKQQVEKEKRRKRRRIFRLVRVMFVAFLILSFVMVLFLIRGGYIWPVTPAMSEDCAVYLQKTQQGWELSWSEGENATAYLVEVEASENGNESLYSNLGEEQQCILPADLPENVLLSLQITPVKQYRIFKRETRRIDGAPMEMKSRLREPDRYVPEWRVDAKRKTLTVGCAGGRSDIYHLYYQTAEGGLSEVSSMQYTAVDQEGSGYGEMVVGFGEDRDFPMPENDQEMLFVLMAERVEGPLRIWEDLSDEMRVRRNDLLSSSLMTEQVALGENRYRISWSETAGMGYRVQRLNEDIDIWETLAEYTVEDERFYDTEHLPAGREYRYRVTSINEGSTVGSQSELSITSAYSPIYATIWPTKDLPLYTTADKAEQAATISVGTALCVTGEEGDMFRVYRPDGDLWIESTYCLIDLEDYLGEMCAYDITNSYYSLYMAHNYELRGISGIVCPGYEHVLQSDGSFLVPLLYPVAKRLALAADRTLVDGYRLKIYDSFRPYVTTRYIFDGASLILDEQAPLEEMRRVTLEEYLSLKEQGLLEGVCGGDIGKLLDDPEPQPIMILDDEGNPRYYNLDGTPYVRVEEQEVVLSEFTYRQLMTTATYGLNYFLAGSGSRHNYGVALDLTLERRDTGEELPMQTAMHDLSYHSIQAANNGEANLLQSYMYDAGFAGLVSEWWHFQDDEVYKGYKLSSVVNGVSSKGWKVDDKGVRFLYEDGTCIKDSILDIDGESRHFDANGYLVQE